MLKTIKIEDINQVTSSRQVSDDQALFTVKEIISQVKEKKDQAVIEYTSLFDQVYQEDYRISQDQIDLAYQHIDDDLINDLKIAYQNIRKFHERQMPRAYQYTMDKDSLVGQLIRPIERVGIYVPGGTAAYPSTVLMNAVPAQVAQVKDIVMISPPNKEGKISDIILAAAKIAGVTEIYQVGGAQGIAALAYGTETIKPVSKIVGPGNIYVALAKKEVFGQVGIDMIAGPSEVLIYADDSSNPKFVAADLLAQAEHDEMARAILVSDSINFVQAVNEELSLQLKSLSRQAIARKSLETNGYAIIVDNQEEAIQAVNIIAPEHLELMVENAEAIIARIKNAGAIFVGPYSPEPLGDYIAGPNHTLPTSGSARFSSPLSTDDFVKKMSYIRFSKQGLSAVQESIQRLANKEGLSAHAQAIKVRF